MPTDNPEMQNTRRDGRRYLAASEKCTGCRRRVQTIVFRQTNGVRLCTMCASIRSIGECGVCGTVRRLAKDGTCRTCRANRTASSDERHHGTVATARCHKCARRPKAYGNLCLYCAYALDVLPCRKCGRIDKRDAEGLCKRCQGNGASRRAAARKKVRSGNATRKPPVQEKQPEPIEAPPVVDLYRWQRAALRRWRSKKQRGVVEAVTGSGKTRFAIAAIAGHVTAGGKVLVLVPTGELLSQWHRELSLSLTAPITVGRMNQEYRGSLADESWSRGYDVLVSTVQSACVQPPRLPPGCRGLLVADECHRYGSEQWSSALQKRFKYRLGLTGTYEREDDGIKKFLRPYFGDVCYRVSYKEALRDNVIAQFRVAFIGTRFSGRERAAYETQAKKASYWRQRLIRDYGLPEEPFGEFMARVNRLRHSGERPGAKWAGMYLSAFSKRRAIMAEARAKLDLLGQLAPTVRAAERSIIFAQTHKAASQAVGLLSRQGLRGAVLTSKMHRLDRQQVFADFRDGESELIAAPRLLDEGIDVPSADLAVVFATSRSRRQLVQRMGRVVRKKADGRIARIAILYIEGTAEDPNEGAHEDFMEMILGAAEDTMIFPAGTPLSGIRTYLRPAWPKTDENVPSSVPPEIESRAAEA